MFLILCVILCFIVFYYLYQIMKRPQNIPPGPQWYPIIGNTLLLKNLAKNHQTQHQVYEKLCEMYNSDIVAFKLGNQLTVFCRTLPLVYSVFSSDKFLGRPNSFFNNLRTMGYRLGITGVDGTLWQKQRRFALQCLRNVGYGKKTMEKQILFELKELSNVIETFKEEPVQPSTFINQSILNILWILTTGERISRDNTKISNLLNLLEKRGKSFDMSGGILGQIPWIRFIMPERSGYNLIKNINKEILVLIENIIKEHYRTNQKESPPTDLIYCYINEIEKHKNDPNSEFTDLQLTMVILDIFIAGSNVTNIMLDVILMSMVIWPNAQEKIHNEIIKVLGDKEPSIQVKHQLPFTEAFIMECERFYHIVSISSPRRATSETTMNGYTIPKDTVVFCGIESVLMDKSIWKDSTSFYPERFLGDNRSQINLNQTFIPFGLGKRKCMGDSLARDFLFMCVVSIIKDYKLCLPENAEIPSTELLPGIMLSPKPYKVIFKKRS